MDNGFITIHRKIIQWEWYTDPNTFRLFIHILLKCNHESKKWQGIEVERGQCITSYGHLAIELKLSVKQIRTALSKLIRTGEVASKGTNKYTLLTVANYDSYQSIDKERASKKASKGAIKGQSKGNQRATNNNDNNDNNKGYTDNFEKLYKIYPNPKNKAQTYNSYKKLLKKYTHIELFNASSLYAKERKGKDKQYTTNSSNFFGQKAVYLDYLSENYEAPNTQQPTIAVADSYKPKGIE